MSNPVSIYIKDVLRWLYWEPVRRIARVIPRGISYRLAWIIGVLGLLAMPRKAARIRRWLEKATGGAIPLSQVLDVFVQYYRNSLDTLLYCKWSESKIDQFADYEGLDNLRNALADGKGAILLHFHFGNEEALMPAIGHKGFKVSQIASRWEPEYLPGRIFGLSNRIRRHAWQMRIRTREKLPVGFVYIDEGLRNIYRLLARNEVLLLAMDGREGVKWQNLPFLGMTARISPGPMKIARSSGAPVLPTLITRTGLYRHTIRIMEPVKLAENAGNADELLRRDSIAALQAAEPFIRKHPSQYAKFIMMNVNLFKDEEE